MWDKNGSDLPGWPQIVYGKDLKSFSPAIGDLNHDGKLEIVFVDWYGTVHVYSADGMPFSNWPFEIPLNWPIATTPGQGYAGPCTLVDLDQDKKLEIVFSLKTYPQAKVYALHHDKTVVSGWPYQLLDQSLLSLSSGDLDNDGTMEVVGASGSGTVYIWNHDGRLRSGWPKQFPAYVTLPVLLDIDADNNLKILFSSGNGSTYLDRQSGVLVPGWPVQLPAGSGSSLVVDISGDGRPAILAAVSGDSLVYAFNSDGSALPGWPKGMTSPALTGLAIADTDNDGIFEMAVTHTAGTDRSALSVWNMVASAALIKLQWPLGLFDNRNSASYVPRWRLLIPKPPTNLRTH